MTSLPGGIRLAAVPAHAAGIAAMLVPPFARSIRRRWMVVTGKGPDSEFGVPMLVRYRRTDDGFAVRIRFPRITSWWRELTGEGTGVWFVMGDENSVGGRGIARRDDRGRVTVTLTADRLEPVLRRQFVRDVLRLDGRISRNVSARFPMAVQRRLLVGPSYGPTSGVAVLSSGFSPGEISEYPKGPPQQSDLLDWLSAHGEPTRPYLAALEATQRRLPEIMAAQIDLTWAMTGEGGELLGRALVEQVPGARWIIWPNCEPAIRIGRRDVDIYRAANRAAYGKGPSLLEVFERERRHAR